MLILASSFQNSGNIPLLEYLELLRYIMIAMPNNVLHMLLEPLVPGGMGWQFFLLAASPTLNAPVLKSGLDRGG